MTLDYDLDSEYPIHSYTWAAFHLYWILPQFDSKRATTGRKCQLLCHRVLNSAL